MHGRKRAMTIRHTLAHVLCILARSAEQREAWGAAVGQRGRVHRPLGCVPAGFLSAHLQVWQCGQLSWQRALQAQPRKLQPSGRRRGVTRQPFPGCAAAACGAVAAAGGGAIHPWRPRHRRGGNIPVGHSRGQGEEDLRDGWRHVCKSEGHRQSGWRLLRPLAATTHRASRGLPGASQTLSLHTPALHRHPAHSASAPPAPPLLGRAVWLATHRLASVPPLLEVALLPAAQTQVQSAWSAKVWLG